MLLRNHIFWRFSRAGGGGGAEPLHPLDPRMNQYITAYTVHAFTVA